MFGMEVVLMVFFEEIILYMPGKFWFGEILAILDENLVIFGQNWLFWEFLTYNFQTQLWIFLIFGMELLLILTLSGEPIILHLVSFQCETKCESLCEQSQKTMKECSIELGMKATKWNRYG